MSLSARFNLKVDVLLLSEEIEMQGRIFQAGDLLVSDGTRTWGMRYHDFVKRVRPTSNGARQLLATAASMAPETVTQEEIEA